MSATELAENVESQIHDAHPFDLKKALLVSVTNGSSGVELSPPLESGDIYDLMESKASSESSLLSLVAGQHRCPKMTMRKTVR